MTKDEAYVTLYRFKASENSGVSMTDADRARGVLRTEFAAERKWKPANLSEGTPQYEKFVREWLSVASLEGVEIPAIEFTEFWNNLSGLPVAMTTHAYHLHRRHLDLLVGFAAKFSLDIDICASTSWKNTRCVLVVLFRSRAFNLETTP